MLSAELYDRFTTLLRQRAGLCYPEQRRSDLIYGLQRAALSLGAESLEQLLKMVECYPSAWDELIAELTIGETYFFRNAAQFTALREIILPDLIQRRAAVRYLRLWSAGCATGEEPYSLAITLHEVLPSHPPWQVSILATDINRRFLNRAREARYSKWSFRETPDHLRDRYFVAEQEYWRLRDDIRRTVTFAQLNLAEPNYPAPHLGIVAFDLIFCRNVLIYFDEETTRQVVQRLYDSLTPGGWLVVGHSEPNVVLFRQFETHNAPGTVLYRKPVHAPCFTTAATPDHSVPRAIKSSLNPSLTTLSLSPSQPPASRTLLTSAPIASKTALAPAEELLHIAHAAADRGAWEEAQAQVEALMKAYPLFAPAYYLQAQIAEHHGQLETALAAYRRSVYLDPSMIVGYIGMAHVYIQLHQPEAARRTLRNVHNLLRSFTDSQIVDAATGSTAAELRAYVTLLMKKVDDR
jgi:chemotaxis protein methyltransferase CheR